LSPELAPILRRKTTPTFTPHVDTGDNVIIVNAEKIELSGNKAQEKLYYRHSGHGGGSKCIPAGDLRDKNPARLLDTTIKGMLPNNPLGRATGKKLHVYAGSEHPHEAQKPDKYEPRG